MISLLLTACGGGGIIYVEPVGVRISPTAYTVVAGNSVTLTVTAQNTTIAWPTLSPDTEGTFTINGQQVIYTPPTIEGTYEFTVAARVDRSQTATALITVVVPKEIEFIENADGINEFVADGITRMPVRFTAEEVWTASISGNCDLNPVSGPAGDNTVNISCGSNDTGANRVVELIVSTNNDRQTRMVTQRPTPRARYTTIQYPGTTSTSNSIVGINNSGKVVGLSSAGYFLYDDGYTLDRYTLFARSSWRNVSVYGINNSGQVAGTFRDSGSMISGFLYDSEKEEHIEFASTRTESWATNIAVYGISDSGRVAGYFWNSNNSRCGVFLYDGKEDKMVLSRELPNCSGATGFHLEINNSGQMTGYYHYNERRGGSYGFLYDEEDGEDGRYTEIIPPGSTSPYDLIINDSGQIAGRFAIGARVYSFLYSNGSYILLDPPSSIDVTVHGINKSGQVAGTFRDSDNMNYGFLYNGGNYSVFNLPTPTDFTNADFLKINDSGQVTGTFDSGRRGFLYNGGNYAIFNPPGMTHSGVIEINDSGQVIGNFTYSDGSRHGFLYHDGRLIVIDPPGTSSFYFREINNSGQIVWGYDRQRARFLLEFE